MNHAGEMGPLSRLRVADRLYWLGATYSGSGQYIGSSLVVASSRNRRGIYCGVNSQPAFVSLFGCCILLERP